MGDGYAGRLLRTAEGVVYWAVAAPVLGCMPAALGYRIACWRGDWLSGRRPPSAPRLPPTCGTFSVRTSARRRCSRRRGNGSVSPPATLST